MTDAPARPPTPTTVADRLRGSQGGLTRAERRVADAVLRHYPMAGLQPVTRLAVDADVSTPTVLRLLTKLGFDGYADFRDTLLGEVSEMLASPVNRVERGREGAVEPLLALAEEELTGAVVDTLRGVDPDALERAIDALADTSRRVLVGGGRMSWPLAAHLTFFLQLMRPGVDQLGPESGAALRARLDLDDRAVVVLFDVRRYQASTVALGREAAAAGAFLVVVTDRHLSPLADGAGALLTASVRGPTPYDGMGGAFTLVETLAAGTIERLGPDAHARVARFDALEMVDDERATTAARERNGGPGRPRRRRS